MRERPGLLVAARRVGSQMWARVDRRGVGLLLLSFLLAAVFVAAVLLVLNRTYDYADDLTVRDYVRAGATSPFSGHLFSLFLGTLYVKVSESVPWYALFLLLVKYLVLVVALHLILKKDAPLLYKAFFSLLFLSMYTLLVMRFSWNTSSLLAAGVAVVAWYDSLVGRRNLAPARGTIPAVPLPVAGGPAPVKSLLLGCLLGVSYSIRPDGTMVAVLHVAFPLLALLALWVLLRRVPFRASLVHLVLFLAPALLVVGEDVCFQRDCSSPAELAHDAAQEARAPVYHTGVYDTLWGAPELLAANGWTRNDIYMIAYAMTLFDENKFSPERFRRIMDEGVGPGAEAVKRDAVYNLLHFGRLAGFKWSDPFAQTDRYGPQPYYGYYVAMVTGVLLVLWRGKHFVHRLFAGLYLLFVYAVALYMINYIRYPWYVSHPLYTTFCLVLFSCTDIDFRGPVRRAESAGGTRFLREPVTRVRSDLWGGLGRVLLWLMLCAGALFATGRFARSVVLLNDEIPEKRAEYLDTYRDLASRFGEDAFFFIRPQLYTEYFIDPLAPGEQGPETHYAALAVSSGAWSPILYKTLERWGLRYGYQILPWMVDNPKAFFLSRDRTIVVRVRTFLYETFGISAEAERAHLYPDGLGVYRFKTADRPIAPGGKPAPLYRFREVYSLVGNLGSARVEADNVIQVTGSTFTIPSWTGGADTRRVLFQHPPSRVSYRLTVPDAAGLSFSLGMSSEVWGLPDAEGDGVEFDIYIEDESGVWPVFSEHIDPKNRPADRRWHDRYVDLSQWAGQPVTVTLATDPGPAADARYDWAGWGEPQLGQWTYLDLAQEFYAARPLPESLDLAAVRRVSVANTYQDLVYDHAPGSLVFPAQIRPHSALYFGLWLDPAVWEGGKGDGVTFEVQVTDGDKMHLLFSRTLGPYSEPWWEGSPALVSVDLAEFSGKEVAITLVTDPGPAGDSSFDWGGWISPRLVERKG